MQVTWNEILERAAKGRLGDIHIMKSNGHMLRGPLTGITRNDDGKIVFNTICVAWCGNLEDDWEPTLDLEPMDVSGWSGEINKEGTISFVAPGLGQVLIYQKHTAHLEPHEVRDLPGDVVRQWRAWIYDIGLDSDWPKIIERVVDDLGADGLTSPHEQIQVQREAQHFA